jgi:hypothetical protein
MNDHELDALVAAAAPPADHRLASALATAPLADLREAILASDADTPDHDALPEADAMTADLLSDVSPSSTTLDGTPLRRPGHRPGRSRRGRVLLVAAVVALAAAGAVVATRDRDAGEAPEPTVSWSEEAMRVAESVPTLLLAPDRWTVSDVAEFSPEAGELRFTRGDEEAELFWRPAEAHQGYVDDRSHSADGPAEPIAVVGAEGVLFQYAGRSESTVLWRDGDHALELRAQIDRAAMRELAATVVRVDADTWLASLPPDVVRAEDRAAVVAGIVEDIPLPPDFDLAAVQQGGMTGGRYELGAEVTQAVTCAWARAWESAIAAGDTAAATRAEQAMATAGDWAILREMNEAGDWPEYVWSWAAAIASGSGTGPNGNPIGSFCTNR